ncbi:MAG: cytochrome P450, partial [Planctomycetota bacterium]
MSAVPVELPPGPRRPSLLQTWAWIRRPGPFLDQCKARFGDAFTCRFAGNRPFLMVSNPDDVRAVFTAPPDVLLSGHANRTFKPFLGEHSLFVMDGAPHRRHRRLLSPPFRGERMRAYGQVMRELTFESVEGWPQGKPFRLLDPM